MREGGRAVAKRLLVLFWEMFKIAASVVGGGFAIAAVADDVFSRRRKWTEEGEIVGSLPVFQMVPGIIAAHTAVYVGRKVAGVAGAFVAAAGVFLPSVVVFSAVTAGYRFIPCGNAFLEAAFLGLRASLAGVIAAMCAKAWPKSVAGPVAAAVMVAALVAIGPLRVNPALVVLAAVLFGVAAEFARRPEDVHGRRLNSVAWAFPLVFLKYGLMAFGGGYVLVPVYLADFVGPNAPYLQLSEGEFANVMALTQMTPGPIAVNCATFFGFRLGADAFASPLAGVACAFAATLALLVPGAVLLYLALGSLERFRASRVVRGIIAGARPATVALMLNALWAFLMMSAWTRPPEGGVAFHPVALAIAIASAALVFTRRLGVVKVILLSAFVSILAELLVKYTV